MSPALKGQVLSQRVIRGAAIYSMRKNDVSARLWIKET